MFYAMSAGEMISQHQDVTRSSDPTIPFAVISEMNHNTDNDPTTTSPGLASSISSTTAEAAAVVSVVKGSKYSMGQHRSPRPSPLSRRRVRAHSFNHHHPQVQDTEQSNRRASLPSTLPHQQQGLLDRQMLLSDSTVKAKSRDALRINDSMVYLDGPQVYTCAQCRTHMTSHDDIISKSFHGRHGRAYLFDQCVNVTIGPSEDRRLITGMHTVSDIFCKRCKTLVGWTYLKAYESSQKYKEGKYIIEKINLHLEESDYYTVAPPAGERADRWRQRSMSWGTDVGVNNNINNSSYSNEATAPITMPGFPVRSQSGGDNTNVIYEYQPSMP